MDSAMYNVCLENHNGNFFVKTSNVVFFIKYIVDSGKNPFVIKFNEKIISKNNCYDLKEEGRKGNKKMVETNIYGSQKDL